VYIRALAASKKKKKAYNGIKDYSSQQIIMKINTENVLPYFQVIIYKSDTEIDLNEYLFSFKTRIKEKNEKSRHFLKIEDIIQDDNPLIIHLVHKKSPTWTDYNTITPSKKANYLEDLENDILIVYKGEDYFFVHSQCNVVLSLAELSVQYISNPERIIKVPPSSIIQILNNENPKINTLGIDNVFNAGGSAPESKAYHSKNAKYCLTPSFDSGYGFSYCLGIISKDDVRQQFGCSLKKSKVWRTWVSEFEEFIENCNELEVILKNDEIKKDIEFLVSPISEDLVEDKSPLEFYLDYTIKKKGIVGLAQEEEIYFDWFCYLNQEEENQIIFQLNSEEDPPLLFLEYTYEEKQWKFNYLDEDVTLSMFLTDNEENTNRRKKDICEFLENQEHFTLIFNEGIAFRNRSFWKDNRINQEYKKVDDSYNWEGVDLRREDRDSDDPDKINILNSLVNYFNGFADLIIGINDNGANEIADLIIITSDKFILIHAKYSASDDAGLRVGDIQVVTAQALKNMKYYIPDSYKDNQFERLFEKSFESDITTVDELKSLIYQSLSNYNYQKECWIVQPGLSKEKLENDSDNKIHLLLNFTQSICKSNDVIFRFIGNK
jgi:hypothetical protein